MSKPTSPLLQLGGASVLAALLWFSYSEYASSKQTLVDKTAELQQCQELVLKIESLRNRPDQATLTSHSARALARAIEQSAAQAKIKPTQIASIEPQAPRRSGDTNYMEHTTVVQLEGVTLTEFAQLSVNLRKLDASLGQLHLTTIRLDSPYREQTSKGNIEHWNVEFTLTYFVYSPKRSPSRAR